MNVQIKKAVCGAYETNAYLLENGALIDPGDDPEAILKLGTPKAILLTHGHFDHMLAAEKLQEKFGIMVYVHEKDAPMLKDEKICVYDPDVSVLPMPRSIRYEVYGDEIMGMKVLHTPGHTAGSVCLYDAEEGVLFSGDTLFRAGFGRLDLPTGSMRDMLDSLKRLFFDLPEETLVYPGHGESTTIGAEKRRNRFFSK